ncbi:RNA-directed DNA polymerase from mobile element jockey [Holothuria leucospilota]|uniref:RNA-directed DNA polymerase from mobile element jockey n=1 Tax=Holothuria leucospilota TaxID=206669 RepID=A0A9Q1CLK3_HOLLE|nr:RNA-directed DNA polymerase from mobile element jockey [Holothuria leucospilota]
MAIKQVTTTKFLGVHIDAKLTWRDHISNISKTISRNVGILFKLKHFLPRNILITLYQTLIIPHLNYCSIVWSGANSSCLNQLTILQKRAVRHITHAGPRDNSPLFIKFKLLKFTDVIDFNIAVFTCKAWNRLLPDRTTFHNFIISNTLVHRHDTRHANFAYRHYYRTNIGSFSLRNRSTKMWNNPHRLNKSSSSLFIFKKAV